MDGEKYHAGANQRQNTLTSVELIAEEDQQNGNASKGLRHYLWACPIHNLEGPD